VRGAGEPCRFSAPCDAAKGVATSLVGAGLAASALDEASQLLTDLTEHYRYLADDRLEEPDETAWIDTPESDEA
jgi:hypothetical protein